MTETVDGQTYQAFESGEQDDDRQSDEALAFDVLAGPILRRLTPERLVIWLAATHPLATRWRLIPQGEGSTTEALDETVAHEMMLSADTMATMTRHVKVGEHLHLTLLDIRLPTPLPHDRLIGYDVEVRPIEGQHPWSSWRDWAADLPFPGAPWPCFVLQSHVSRLLHGSCRKPHYSQPKGEHPDQAVLTDGMARAEQWLSEHWQDPGQWPALLMLSGDQIYADDVAGPMLSAIHQVCPRLGVINESFRESLPEIGITDAAQLHQEASLYYQRAQLLPNTPPHREMISRFFGGVRKPIFTSDNAHNHLMSLGEVMAMYLLVWSPRLWADISLQAPQGLSEDHHALWQREAEAIAGFRDQVSAARRVMAHLPTAMMFDDHDITDDWNLTIGWEQSAYEHPLSRRIIGNALIGYLLCQGWGNDPDRIPEALWTEVEQALSHGGQAQDALIDTLLRFDQWHYQWPTTPPLMVLDTRTHRWRSERGIDKPSGLMDWEALTDLQHALLGHDAVILVSPAPMFGVKLIEAIQRVFTWFGKPLMVDAENWMAHPGAAYALMNLFRHPRTPRHYVILSGDVHYSFVYDVELRGHDRGPDIWQITSSGLHNAFPQRLLDLLDRLNRWLYAPWSPLNWLTKRRHMRVIPRKPSPASPGERLVNATGIGLVDLNQQGQPIRVLQLCADGRDIQFDLHEAEARWE
ncbi:alkaline phosphatase D family protein [Terasakiispira papahanaumokuakeensis]|uniref:alkaline phosphatase D family protein n=1 Tax=Terasakiispira papahanaumokuakeensis TaxID=197479 RepID=UPI000A4BA7BE|nr:alkaline phosphatase D family protein [Terasakiispira papahanaumokuakeensis]